MARRSRLVTVNPRRRDGGTPAGDTGDPGPRDFRTSQAGDISFGGYRMRVSAEMDAL